MSEEIESYLDEDDIGGDMTLPEIMKDISETPKEYWEEQRLKIKAEAKRKKEAQDLTSLRSSVLTLIASRREDEASEEVTRYILNNYKIVSIKQDKTSEIWVRTKENIYKQIGEATIKEICREVLTGAYTPQRANKVIAKIEADTFQEADVFYKKANENKEEIPVLNGVLNVITKELRDYCDEDIFFHKVNAEYKPEADCPNIDKFLKEVLKYAEDSKVFYESCGYDLFKENFLEVAFMLYGDGGNGKSKTISIKKTFLGVENCGSVPLNQLVADSFSVSGLFGKLVNLCGDLSNTDLKDTGMFKQLTGRDLITAKRKFMTDLVFENFSKQYFPLNEFPRVYDLTAGFWRRWIILEFPYKFVPKEEYDKAEDKTFLKIQDPQILDKLTTPEELSGLLNRALEGLETIRTNKRFSYTKGTEEIKQFWIRKSDSFTAFCMDNLEESVEGYVSKKDLRKSFSLYCKKHKVKGASDQNIKVVLENMFGVTEGRRTINDYGERDMVWEGVKFKPILQSVKEVKGFLPYSEIPNSYIGLKTIDTLASFTKEELEQANFTEKELLEVIQ